MKKIILATLAAAALVACAKEDVVVASEGETIAFNNAFIDNSVRSVDPSTTKDNLEGFRVYGTTEGDHTGAQIVNIFNNVLVGFNLSDGIGADAWKYENQFVQYWIAGNTYNFAAVANAADDTVAVDSYGMPSTISYNAVTRLDKDLLYATYDDVVGLKSGNAPIAFTFNHLLAKVKFTFKNLSAATTNNKYTYRVSNIEVYNIGKEAVCNVANYNATSQYYSWVAPTAFYAEDAALNFGNIVATNEKDKENTTAIKVAPNSEGSSLYEHLVIPGRYDNLTVKCRIELLYNDDVVDVQDYKESISYGIEGGNSFNFVLTGQVGEEIQFTVNKVNGWTENETNL